MSKNFKQSKYNKNKKKERFNSEERERIENKTKENNMKCIVSKPNHANLFVASDWGNPLVWASQGHDDFQDGTSPPLCPPSQASLCG